MLYKEKMSGVRISRVPSIDISVVAAMFALIVMAWGVSKIDRTFFIAEREVPVFTISQELSVMPVIETKTNKDAVKVGNYMSLAKSGTTADTKVSSATDVNTDAPTKIVLAQPISTGASILPPKIVYKSIPDYPIKAIEMGLSGMVMVKVYILKNGRVGEAVVEQSSGHEMLDRSAVASVSQWVFEPAIYGKESTEAYFKIPVKFQLKS